jgi:hypothetical protein
VARSILLTLSLSTRERVRVRKKHLYYPLKKINP